MEPKTIEQKSRPFIVTVSIVIPVVVAILFNIKLSDLGYTVEPMHFLPPIYAGINGLTAIFLVAAVVAIKKGNRQVHERLMTASIVLSILFLVMYVLYHMTTESTKYGGDGFLRLFYFVLLISHIALSITIIPLVLITYVRALSARFDKHKKIAKITFPLWLYVAVTGVLVYWMISPYYAS
jgi:putative membrane protein